MFSSHQEPLNLRSRKLAQQWRTRDRVGAHVITPDETSTRSHVAAEKRAPACPSKNLTAKPERIHEHRLQGKQPRVTRSHAPATRDQSQPPRVFGVTFRITRYFAVACCSFGSMFAQLLNRIVPTALLSTLNALLDQSCNLFVWFICFL